MKKTPFLVASHFIIQSLIILSIFVFASFFTYADTSIFYSCVDKEGNETVSDYPMDGKNCKPIGEYKKMTDEEALEHREKREQIRDNTYKEIQAERKIKEEKAAKRAEEEAKRAKEEATEKRLRDAEARAAAAERAAANAAGEAWRARQEAARARQEADRNKR